TGLPFRVKMAAISAAAVLLTLAVILIPVYVGSRDTLTRVQGERLLSIARSATVSLSGETVDSVWSDGQTSPAFRTARTYLQRVWVGNGGSVRDLVNGIAVVRREPTGVYRYVVHSSWQPGQPQYTAAWLPPEAIADSLAAGRDGITPIYDSN